jgi:hypothetical protein
MLFLFDADIYLPSGGEDLSCCVCFDVAARCHHDVADHPNEQRQQETLRSAPHVEELCQRDLTQTTDDGRHDARCGCERMETEGAGNVWVHGANDDFLKCGYKVDPPDADTLLVVVSSTYCKILTSHMLR